MTALADGLAALPPLLAAALFLLLNLFIFGAALLAGSLLVQRFSHRRLTPPPPPVERRELLLAASTVGLNTLITFVGWLLWRADVIEFRTDTGLRALLDVPVLLLAMDLAMYVLHRVAHHPSLFARLHAPHHRSVHARPLTLFVLAPLENLGFGALWLAVVAVYPASWLGMSAYLVLNVAFGVLGHLGVEPAPDGWVRLPVLGALTTTTFHAQHHLTPGHNFGFYTLLWDRLYEADFARPQAAPESLPAA
jgi:lathosterol oxidase